MKSVLLPPGTNQTITVNVGAGGYGNGTSGTALYNGSNSSIVFGASITSPSLISNTLTAFGGGAGAACSTSNVPSPLSGGSGGGGGRSYINPPGLSVGNSNGTTSNYNWGNPGGISVFTGSSTSGGGGAGGPGFQGTDAVSVNGCAGGPGIQCTLPGISQFTPSGFSAYGTYYWGGGGSGATLVTGGTGNYGRGGLGGGGGSWGNSVYPNGSGGITTNATAGMGGANTGGGGGGQWTVGGSGGGGSGIVVIAFPTFPVSTDMTPFTAVNSFASANVLNLPVGVTYGGVAVSLLQDKLLVACNAGVYCYTSANSGASWTLLSTLSTSAFRCCAMSADGTKGVVSENVGQIYYVNWSTGTPTMASFDATSRTYGGISMTPDGYKINVTDSVNNWSSNWNGTTYTALSLPTDVISTVGLMNYYKFNASDLSGTTVKNYATGTYDATLIGTSTISTTQSKFGGASFYSNAAANNTTNYCTLPGFTFNGTTGMTIAFWTYVTSYAVGDAPFKFAINSSAVFINATYYGQTMRPWYGTGTANQNPITQFVVDTNGTDTAITGSSVTILNQWNHLVYVFTGTTLTMYANGTLYGSVTFSAALQNITYAWFVVGGDNNANGGQQAYFDEFRAYSRQITAGEVSALYNWNNTTNLATGSVGIAVSPDGNNIISVNASGTEYTSYGGILNSVNITGPSGNAKGMCFLGGGQTGNPTNFLLASGSGTAGTLTSAYSMYLYQWNNSNNALKNPQIVVNNFGSVENTSLTPGGAQGNVVYYLQNTASSGTSCYVSTLTLGVTTLPSGFDVFNPVLGGSTITFGTYSTLYSNVCCSTNGNYVYVMQKGSGNTYDLYSSSNGGLSFSRASSTTVSNVYYSQLVCDGTGQYVWYTGNNAPAVYYSYNYGVTFTVISGLSIYYSMTMSRDGTKIMLSGQNAVAYSSNGTATTPTFTTGTQTGAQGAGNVSFLASSSTGQYCYYPNAAGSSNMVFSSDYGHTYTSLMTPTGQATTTASIGCDITGQYVAYVSSAFNVCYLSNNYGANWTLLNTTVIPSASLKELRLFTTSSYIYIIMSGDGASPFTNNLYGGYSLISGCAVASNWTWTTLRSDMRYAGMTISDTGMIYVVGESQVLMGSIKDISVFPMTNLIYDFTTASGTSTTTNGATLTSWKDARTGKSLSGGTATYNTTTTINSYPTTTSYMNLTYGNITTVQNYWTWICVLRTGGTALSGDNNMIYNSSSYALEIGLNGGNLKVCYSAIAWSVGAASVSGGSAGTWIAATNTNYILAVICRSTNNTTSSTQSYTFRINGVDYTPASNTDSRYYYINNPQIGNINSTTQTFMGEQMLFNTDMNVGSVQYIEQYLSYKWGIGLGTTTKVIASPPFTN